MDITKYVGTPLSAVEYTRCKYVAISNEVGTLPTITFTEEKVVKIGEQAISKEPLEHVLMEQLTMSNIGTTFPLLDSDTLAPLGQNMSYATLSVAIRSLYAFLAARRDAQGN